MFKFELLGYFCGLNSKQGSEFLFRYKILINLESKVKRFSNNPQIK